MNAYFVGFDELRDRKDKKIWTVLDEVYNLRNKKGLPWKRK